MKIGIDLGGVIAQRMPRGSETSFFVDDPNSDAHLAVPPVKGAFEAIALLAVFFGPENIFIISKCGTKVEKKSREWLVFHRFYEITGISPENVYYTRTRAEKGDVASKLDIDAMVDDRLECLVHVSDTAQTLLCFDGEAKEIQQWENKIDDFAWTLVFTWAQVVGFLSVYTLGGDEVERSAV